MAHSVTFDSAQSYIVVAFEGEITPQEEMEAFLEVVSDPRMYRDARILVDKSAARMKVGTEHVPPQLQAVEEHTDLLGRMRIAHVVADNRDYGMMRVIEQRSEGRLPHELGVFRSLEEAVGWLSASRQEPEGEVGPPV